MKTAAAAAAETEVLMEQTEPFLGLAVLPETVPRGLRSCSLEYDHQPKTMCLIAAAFAVAVAFVERAELLLTELG